MKPSKPRSAGPRRTDHGDRPRRHDNDDRPKTRFDEERQAQRNAAGPRSDSARPGGRGPRRDDRGGPGRSSGDRDRNGGGERSYSDRNRGPGGERSFRPRGPGKDPSIQVWRPEDDNIGNRDPGPRGNDNRRSFDDRPRGDRVRDDRPRDDRPRSDRPRDDRPRSDRPRGDGPRADGPRNDRFRDDRPRGDRPRDDRPRSDRPRDDRPPREGGERPRREFDRPRDGDRPRDDRPRPERPRPEFLERSEREAPRRERYDRDEMVSEVDVDSAPVKPENAQRRDETRIHGVNACKAFFAVRPQDLIRVYLTQSRAPQFAEVMKHCVNERLAYHIIPDEELARAAETEHHEGVCFLVKKRVTQTLDEWLATVPAKGSRRVLALENVGNPHNLGAILRTAAHFGVDAVLVNAGAPVHSGAVARTAEGGFEALTLVEYRDLAATFAKLGEAGFELLATSGEGTVGLFDQKLPKRAVIWFGEEHSGLSDFVLEHADTAIKIPGSGAVESLNVSCAVAVVLAEWQRTSGK